MGLIDLQTNLKSLRYGKDRIHGGDSGQPYIQTSIPNNGGDFNIQGNVDLPGNDDFIIRGGLYAFKDTAQDILRLGKFFIDLKNPNGLLFTAKQNLLSRVAVRTEASDRLNGDVYLPTSTLAQAGVNAFGFHFNKQGLNPIPGNDGSIKTYQQAVQYEQYENINPGQSKGNLSLVENNKLVALYALKISKTTDPKFYEKYAKEDKNINGIIIKKDDNINLLEYLGGPGSILGIGNTKIKLYCGQTRDRKSNRDDTDRTDIEFEQKPIERAVAQY